MFVTVNSNLPKHIVPYSMGYEEFVCCSCHAGLEDGNCVHCGPSCTNEQYIIPSLKTMSTETCMVRLRCLEQNFSHVDKNIS